MRRLRDNAGMLFLERLSVLGTCALAVLCTSAAWAEEPAKPVYRCPGPPVLYTDALSAAEARDKGCRTIEGAPVTIVQAPRRGCRPAGS